MERTGGPEVLTVREVPDPEPGEGQVLVDVEAVGVNFRDVYEREGRPPYGGDLPRGVGAGGAGTGGGTGERGARPGGPGSYAPRGGAPPGEVGPGPGGVPRALGAPRMLHGCAPQYPAP